MDNLPKYYLVDGDIFVKVMADGDDVIAVNHLGNPYPPMKAAVNGVVITKEEYEAGKAANSPKKT
jgi:hypothetical protein